MWLVDLEGVSNVYKIPHSHIKVTEIFKDRKQKAGI